MSVDSAPRFTVGFALGHYIIRRAVGAGGMGEVYEAEDIRLRRRIALKVVRRDLAADPVRRARLEREATAAATLNHPNVVTVHSLEEQNGHLFITMELVDGTTLADAIPSDGFPLHRVLRLGMQLAEALGVAHAAGVVHRDLKPANVMLTRDDTVKVLDFGLSRRTLDETAATRTAIELTSDGAVLGTAPYIAPEQIEGRPADARSDIFSLGVMLYELATGERPFRGPTMLSTLTAIAKETPPLASAVKPAVPEELARIIDRCLAKDSARRVQSAIDLRYQLEDLARLFESGRLRTEGMISAKRRLWQDPRVLALGGGLVVISVGATLLLGNISSNAPRPMSAASTSTLRRLTADGGLNTQPALSPDGRLVAYASDRAGEGNLDIWVQQVAGGDPLRVTRDPADQTTPTFSPDGTQIAFRSKRDGGGIFVVPALGGEPMLLAPGGFDPRFSPDGRWLAYHTGIPGGSFDGVLHFGSGKLFIIPARGGTPRQIQPKATAIDLALWSPDSRFLLARASFTTGIEPFDWWVTPVGSGDAIEVRGDVLRRQGADSAEPVAWLPGDRLVFTARSGDSRNTWWTSLSRRDWQLTGGVERVTLSAGVEGAASIVPVGVDRYLLALANVTENVDLWSVPLARDGLRPAGEPIRLTYDSHFEGYTTITADGRTLVFAATGGGIHELWSRDMPTGRQSRLVSLAPESVMKPVLSPDGSRLAFWRMESPDRPSAVFVTQLSRAPDGVRAGVLRQLPAVAPEGAGWPWSWSPSGDLLWYDPARWPRREPNHLYDFAAGAPVSTLGHAEHDLAGLQVSPDAQRIAFLEPLDDTAGRLVVASVSRRNEVAPASEWTVIDTGDHSGLWNAWSPAGDVLYYQSRRDGYVCIWAQRFAHGTGTPLGSPTIIHHAHSARLSIGAIGPNRRGFAVARDKIVFNMVEMTGNIWTTELLIPNR